MSDVTTAAAKSHVNGALKDVADGKSDVFKVDPRIIKTKEGWNLRNAEDPKNVEHIEALKVSIIEWGIQTPLGVYMEGGAAYVADGHCRLAACMAAIAEGHEIALVPCIALPRHFSEVDKVAMMVVRNGGLVPQPIELAGALARMANYGLDEKAIAKKVGYTPQRVADLLRLNSAPVAIVDLVKDGTISASLATQTLRASKGDDAAAVKSITKTVDNAKAAGKTRATAKHADSKPERKAREPKAAEGDLTRHPAYEAGLRRALEILKGLGGDALLAEGVMGVEAELTA